MYCTPAESVLFKWRNASQTLIVKHKVTKMKCIANFFIVHIAQRSGHWADGDWSDWTDWMSTKEYRKTSGPSYYFLTCSFASYYFGGWYPRPPQMNYIFLVSFTTEEGPLRHPRTIGGFCHWIQTTRMRQKYRTIWQRLLKCYIVRILFSLRFFFVQLPCNKLTLTNV